MIKLPNIGNPSVVQVNNFYSKSTKMYMNYTESQYLLKSRELRWALQGGSELSGEWGERNAFSYIISVGDSGTSTFDSITQNLTVNLT